MHKMMTLKSVLSRRRPISAVLFYPLLLIVGLITGLTMFQIMAVAGACLSVVVVLLMVALGPGPVSSWSTCIVFSLLWGMLVVGRIYVRRFSELGGKRRLGAAITIALTSCPLFLITLMMSIFYLDAIRHPDRLPAGLLVWQGLALMVFAQIREIIGIYREKDRPVASLATHPRSSRKRDALEGVLADVNSCGSPEALNKQVLKALGYYGISGAQIKTKGMQPIEALLEVLLAEKNFEQAENLSRKSLQLVEESSGAD